MIHHGSCLCSKINITVNGKLSSAEACHCAQCRKRTGHFGVTVETERENLTIKGEQYVKYLTISFSIFLAFRCALQGALAR